MRVIIAGSRSISDWHRVWLAIEESGFVITEVVSGGASGVDSIGEDWAAKHCVSLKKFPADWSLGLRAGPIRNAQMANYADALIAVWDGESRGTANMIENMHKLGKPVYAFKICREEL